ncbi:MAG: ABC transporter permease [Lachnospiraceae bacterium]|nr:ABC transporter permease [Lachnospiraceae bacterium]
MKASKNNRMVFRLYMAVIKKNLGYIAMYFGIFIIMALIFSSNQSSQAKEMFQPVKVTIPVIDRDQSEASRALRSFLSQDNETYLFEGDEKELNRGLYYREIGYILTIPEGFGASLEPGAAREIPLEAVKLPGSTAGYYIDAELQQFLMRYRTYLAAGFFPEEAGQRTLALKGSEARVQLEGQEKKAQTLPNWAYSFNYLPYLYLSVFIYCVSFVLKSFRERHVADRLKACPIPARTQALQGFLAFATVFAAIWFASMLIPLIARGADFYTSPHRGWVILNSLAFLLVAASIAFMVGNLAKSEVAITGLTNVIGLGMCFLGGVFIPPDVLGENVQKFSRFLPSWWYVRAVNTLGLRQGPLSAGDLQLITESLLVQCAFAAGFFALTLFLIRQKGEKA